VWTDRNLHVFIKKALHGYKKKGKVVASKEPPCKLGPCYQSLFVAKVLISSFPGCLHLHWPWKDLEANSNQRSQIQMVSTILNPPFLSMLLCRIYGHSPWWKDWGCRWPPFWENCLKLNVRVRCNWPRKFGVCKKMQSSGKVRENLWIFIYILEIEDQSTSNL
jgi:hypothetical protein